MSSRRRLVAVVAALAAAVRLGAHTGIEVRATRFLPERYYVGDRVELWLTAVPEKGVRLSSPPAWSGSGSPKAADGRADGKAAMGDWLLMDDIAVRPGRGAEYEIRVSFVSFYPGVRTLPDIVLGDAVLRDIKINTRSLLEEGAQAFADSRGQVLLPGTRLSIAVIVTALVLLAVFGARAFKWAGRRVSAVMLRRRRERPFRGLVRVLRYLSDRRATIDGGEFYELLTHTLRNFLGERFDKDCVYATTSELDGLLGKGLAAADRETVLSVFRFGDSVKFGRRPAPVSVRNEHIEQVARLVCAIEGKERASVDV